MTYDQARDHTRRLWVKANMRTRRLTVPEYSKILDCNEERKAINLLRSKIKAHGFTIPEMYYDRHHRRYWDDDERTEGLRVKPLANGWLEVV